MSQEKTTITVEREAAHLLGRLARERGVSITKVASDAIRLAVEALERGVTIDELRGMWKVQEAVKTFDDVFMPVALLTKILEGISRERLLVEFYEYGKELGVALSQELSIRDLFKNHVVLSVILPARMVRCEMQGEVCISVVLPPRSGLAEFVAATIRGILDGYNVTHKVETKSNIIRIHIEKLS
ncbi:MAG: hypothetical protein ACK4SY_06395 [Pyrobaculum sp.]